MLDNLRRSLTPPALLLLFVLGWTVLPGSAWFWTFVGLAVPFLPLLLNLPSVILRLLLRPWRMLLTLRDLTPGLRATAGHAVVQVAFLAHQAWTLLDAVGRTLTRLFVTRRDLLEWEAAAATERRLGNNLPDFIRFMAIAPATAIAFLILIVLMAPASLPAAAPLLLLWFVSPALAWWLSQPLARTEIPLSDTERRAMRRIARKTWDFFEQFVTADDNGLPPDNYQEDPKGELAHRTSPTNIGLSLAANLAAHDFGYVSLAHALDRIDLTLTTIERLEKYRGHIFNWYDTRTLKPLEPRYVSTVDSGNLLASLLAVRQGLLEKARQPLTGPFWLDGLADTLHLAMESLAIAGDVPGVRDVLSAVAAAVGEHTVEARSVERLGGWPVRRGSARSTGRRCRLVRSCVAGWNNCATKSKAVKTSYAITQTRGQAPARWASQTRPTLQIFSPAVPNSPSAPANSPPRWSSASFTTKPGTCFRSA